jgi:hypothetical protein
MCCTHRFLFEIGLLRLFLPIRRYCRYRASFFFPITALTEMRKLKQVVCVGYLNIVGYSAFEIEEASREEVLQTIHARSAGISLQEFHLLGPQKAPPEGTR